MTLLYVTVVGNLGPAAAGAKGYWVPTGWLTAAADMRVIPPAPAPPFTIGADGSFTSGPLLAQDSPGIQPQGEAWTLSINGIDEVAPFTQTYGILHANGATQDLASLPVAVPTQTFTDYLLAANNLSDVDAAATALANLGGASTTALAAEVTRAESAESTLATAISAETTRAEAAEALLAPLASPALTGSPTAPTQTTGDSSTKIATDAFVGTAVAAETTRAEGAEAALATGVSANAAAITAETSRAEAAESTLASGVAASLPKAGGTMTGGLVTQVPNIVFVGDSLTNGTGSLPFNSFPLSNDYPSQAAGSLPAEGTYHNVGVGGQTVSQEIVLGPTVVDPLLIAGAANVVCMHGGTNDLQSNDNATTTYNLIVTYCQARQAAGWTVIASTITPRSDAGTPGDFETQRQALNALIRANWPTFASGLADVGNDATIGQATQQANAQYYNGDLVHHNPNGYKILARYFLAALETLGVTGHQHGDRSGLISDLWVPATAFTLQAGAPVLAVTGHVAAWQLRHGFTDQVVTPLLVPRDWLSYNVQTVWTNTAAATGNALLVSGLLAVAAGSNVNSGFSSSGNITVTSPASAIVVFTTMFTANAVDGLSPSRTLQQLSVFRNGTSGGDTMTGDTVNLIGAYVYRTA